MENEENQEQVFHRFPPPLEIAARFPHSHSRGNDREEKWKSKSRIPTFPSRLVVSLQILERRILLNAGSAVLQAHPSIRKCFPLWDWYPWRKRHPAGLGPFCPAPRYQPPS